MSEAIAGETVGAGHLEARLCESVAGPEVDYPAKGLPSCVECWRVARDSAVAGQGGARIGVMRRSQVRLLSGARCAVRRGPENVSLFSACQSTWPGSPTAASARESGQGMCAAKHVSLRERLHALGLECERLMVVGLASRAAQFA